MSAVKFFLCLLRDYTVQVAPTPTCAACVYLTVAILQVPAYFDLCSTAHDMNLLKEIVQINL